MHLQSLAPGAKLWGMKPRRKRPAPGPHWKAAEAYGFDMSLVDLNLEMSPEERLRAHDQFRQLADVLRDAMRKQRAKVS